MSVVITSSQKIGIINNTVGNSGITISAPQALNFTTDNLTLPDNPALNLTQVMSGISNQIFLGSSLIDCTQSLDYPLLTVPANTTYYISLIQFILMAITGTGDEPIVSVGITSPNYQDIIDGITHNDLFVSPYNINTVGQILPLSNFPALSGNSGVDYAALVTGDVLNAQVNTPSSYTSYLVQCSVFGFSSTTA